MPSFDNILADIFDRRAEKNLTVEEERDAILAAKDGDQDATVDLLLAYAPALRNAAGQYRNAGGVWSEGPRDPHAAEDLRSAAILGLLEAIQAFDPEVHIRLAAVVKGNLANALQASVVSPVAFSVPSRTLKRFYMILRKAGGDVVKGAELAPQYEMTVSTFMDVLAAVRSADLALPSGEDDQATIAAWEAAKPVWGVEPDSAEDELLVEVAFASVDEMEGDVCRLAYGFADYEPVPDAEIAHRMGLSRQKAQRVRSGALGKMRNALGVA